MRENKGDSGGGVEGRLIAHRRTVVAWEENTLGDAGGRRSEIICCP